MTPPEPSAFQSWSFLIVAAFIIGSAWMWWAQIDHEHELKVCKAEGYAAPTAECRRVFAEEAVDQQEKAEWCGKHPNDGSCK